MDSPPFTRFRLRVEIVACQDGRNVTDALCKLIFVKTPSLPLPDLTIGELCHEFQERFKSMYPSEPLFEIHRFEDSEGYDIHFENRVREVFVDNDILRIVRGSTIRASVELDRTSVTSPQAIEFSREEPLVGQKRRITSFDISTSRQVEKRRRTSHRDTDRPIRSRERDFDAQKEGRMSDDLQLGTLVQDSQPPLVGQGTNISKIPHVKSRSSLAVLEAPPSIQKVDGVYKDIELCNSGKKPAAHLQPIDSPFRASRSGDYSLASGPGAQLYTGPRQSSNGTLLPYDVLNDTNNLNNTSTTFTTPPSNEQQLDHSLPALDNKLKRSNRTEAPGRDGGFKTPRAVSRKDIYDDVGSDSEQTSVKIGTSIDKKASSKLVNGNDIGQEEVIVTQVKQRRRDPENQVKVNLNLQRAEGQSVILTKAEERRRIREAKEKEMKDTVLRAKPANNSEERTTHKLRDSHDDTVTISDARAKPERQRQLQQEVEANKKRNEAQRPNADRQTRSQNPPNGMLSRAVGIHETSTANEVNTDPSANNPKSIQIATHASRQSSSTAHIPPRKPSGLKSPAVASAQTVGGSTPAETSSRSHRQTPVPPPVKRKVSFNTSVVRKSGTPSSSLKQSTLAEPHLGIADVKSTPKRNANRSGSSGLESSKPIKDKTKAFEYMKQPEVIVIPSDTEVSTVDSLSKVDGRNPTQATNPTKRPPSSSHDFLVKAEPESSPKSSSLPLTKSSSQVLRGRPSPRGHESHATPRPAILPPGVKSQTTVSHVGFSHFNDKEYDEDVGSDETDQDETTEHDQVRASNNELIMEANVEDENSSKDTSTSEGRSVTENEEKSQIEELRDRRSSLRQYTKESDRTRDADQRAAKARAVAKAQRERDAARQVSESEGTDEDSSSQSSSTSGTDSDDEATGIDRIPKTPLKEGPGRKTTSSSRSRDLGSEEAEEIVAKFAQRRADPRSPQVNSYYVKADQSRKKNPLPTKELNKVFSARKKNYPRG